MEIAGAGGGGGFLYILVGSVCCSWVEGWVKGGCSSSSVDWIGEFEYE